VSSLQETSLATLPELALLSDNLFMIASAWPRCNGREGWWNDTFGVPYVSPHSEGAQEERLLELGEETVEEDMDRGVSTTSDVAERTNVSFPFEITYAVQKLGVDSEILVAVLLPLSFLKSNAS